MTKSTCVLFLLFAGVLSAAETKLYKYTDDNGVTHYSQRQIDERYEAITPPAVTVVPSQLKTTPKPQKSEEEDALPVKELVKSFRLTNPKPEENLWGTGQTVTASAKVAAALFEIYDVQYVLDGKAKPANSRATQKFTNVVRGEHKIYGQLVEKGSNRVIKKSQEVTFYIHQHSKK
mgnify:FL=1